MTGLAQPKLPVTAAIAARALPLSLSTADTTRYSRHLLLAEVGIDGQKRLSAARVLVVGAGGLGSPVCLYLAAAGVGSIGIVDHDRVDLSNLQRQILFAQADQGRLKAEAAAERLRALSSSLNLQIYPVRLDASNVARLIADYDIIVDGTDNFSTRYLLNDACTLFNKPNIHGSIFRFDGQASVFYPPHGPCYRCLFPTPPAPGQVPSCAEGGVLGVLPAQIGSIQATEVIKLILGAGQPLIGRLLTFEALSMRFNEFKISRDPQCPVCSDQASITTIADAAIACDLNPQPHHVSELIAPQVLHDWRTHGRHHLLIDVRSAAEAAICQIDGSRLISLQDLQAQSVSLEPRATIVVYCKSGARSRAAQQLLQAKGFQHVFSLDGGILNWITAIDKTLPRY